MPVSLTAKQPDITRRRKHLYYFATPTGNYTTGGDPIDFSAVLNPSFYGAVVPGSVPSEYTVTNVPGGYGAAIIVNPTAPATPTISNALALKVWTASGAELPAGAYPAALTAAPMLIELIGGPFTL